RHVVSPPTGLSHANARSGGAAAVGPCVSAGPRPAGRRTARARAAGSGAVVAVRWSKKADATVKRRPEKPWRRRRDSNPRQGYKPRYGLANRPRRPLEYSSAIAALIVYHEPVFLSNHLGPATAPGDPGRPRCAHAGAQPGRAPAAPRPGTPNAGPGLRRPGGRYPGRASGTVWSRRPPRADRRHAPNRPRADGRSQSTHGARAARAPRPSAP